MTPLTRRALVRASAASAALMCLPRFAGAATTQCAAGLPDRLTVDCASRQNFRTFRKYPDDLGLAGVVSMAFVQGRLGSYPAANLFLFPWVKPAGQALVKKEGKHWPAVAPSNETLYVSAAPIPDATLPLDEYFCRCVLQAPGASFIGFELGVPFTKAEGRLPWFTNVALADGKDVGILWNSPNLNAPWFDGDRWIPGDATCNGAAWRQLIIHGLNAASTGACYG